MAIDDLCDYVAVVSAHHLAVSPQNFHRIDRMKPCSVFRRRVQLGQFDPMQSLLDFDEIKRHAISMSISANRNSKIGSFSLFCMFILQKRIVSKMAVHGGRFC